jgi:hypothetical protein
MLDAPCLKPRGINRIGQSPRCLVGKICPARLTQLVDDLLPADLFWSHDYHQPLPRPDVAVAQVSGQWRLLGGHCFARTTLNPSLIVIAHP